MEENYFSKNRDISIFIALIDSDKYNKISFLKKCLDSLRQQSFINFEVIIFDNINNTEISNLITNYTFTKYIYFNYTNPVDALNYGFKNSNSKYITFINYNFYFEKEYLSYLKMSLESSEKSDFIFSSHEIISKRKITTRAQKISPVDLIFNFPGIISFLFKKSIIDKIGYLDNNIYGVENFDYFIRIALYNPNYLILDYTLTHLDINSEDKDNFDYFELEKKIANKLDFLNIDTFYPFIKMSENYDKLSSYAYYSLAMNILNTKKKAFNVCLTNKIPELFIKSYNSDKSNFVILINYFYFCKKLNIDYKLFLNDNNNIPIIDSLPNNLIEIQKYNDFYTKSESYLFNQEINLTKILSINFSNINIKKNQFVVSKEFNYLKDLLINNYDLIEYNSISEPVIFLGFDDNIKNILIKHTGKKFFLWIDHSFDILINDFLFNKLNIFKTSHHITNNKIIYSNLVNMNLKPFFIEINIFNIKNNSFKYNKNSKKILVYNGLKNSIITNNIIYNNFFIDKIKKDLPNYEFIFTKDLDNIYENYDNLNDVKCLLKFTNHNMHYAIFEYFNYLNIPIISNHFEYSLKYNTIDDIAKIIYNL